MSRNNNNDNNDDINTNNCYYLINSSDTWNYSRDEAEHKRHTTNFYRSNYN